MPKVKEDKYVINEGILKTSHNFIKRLRIDGEIRKVDKFVYLQLNFVIVKEKQATDSDLLYSDRRRLPKGKYKKFIRIKVLQ